MQILAVASAQVARAASTCRMARAFGVLVALLAGACGADAGGGIREPATEAALPLSPAPSSPRTSAPSDEVPSEVPQHEPEGTMLAAPSIPLVPPRGAPSRPEPLPSAALDTSRPLLPPAPAEVVIPPGDCRFEFLGEWVRCENAGWPNVVETDAMDLGTCMQRCLEDEACTAVTDYLWLGQPSLGCYLYRSSCDEPLAVAWGEEDAGREFRRACSSDDEASAP